MAVLTGITAVDLGNKIYDLTQMINDLQGKHFATGLSSRSMYQLRKLAQLQGRLSENGRAIRTIFLLEVIGLGIASKIFSVGNKVYQKMTRSDLLADALYSFNLRGQSVINSTSVFYKKGLYNEDLIKEFFQNASDKEVYDFVVKSHGLSLGKKVLASETVVELSKLGYVMQNGSLFLEVSPVDIIFKAISNKYEDHGKQFQLNHIIHEELN